MNQSDKHKVEKKGRKERWREEERKEEKARQRIYTIRLHLQRFKTRQN